MASTRRRLVNAFAAVAMAASAALIAVTMHASPARATVSGFVTRSGDQLELNGQPFRFISANTPG